MNKFISVIAAVLIAAAPIAAHAEVRRTAYFTVGHDEAEFAAARELLEQEGYISAELDIKADGIPDEADVVIIAHPKSDFTEKELEAAADYIKNGGVIEVYADTECKDIKNLNSFLSLAGIALSEGGIAENSDYVKDGLFMADIASSGVTDRVSAEYIMYAPYARPLELTEVSKMIDVNEYIVSSPVSAVTKDFKTAGEVGSAAIAARSINYNTNGTIYVCGTNMLLDRDLEELQAQAPVNAEYFVSVTNGLADLEEVFENPETSKPNMSETAKESSSHSAVAAEAVIGVSAVVAAAVIIILRLRKRSK